VPLPRDSTTGIERASNHIVSNAIHKRSILGYSALSAHSCERSADPQLETIEKQRYLQQKCLTIVSSYIIVRLRFLSLGFVVGNEHAEIWISAMEMQGKS
jgi:hypothetical protein